jgi:hypothetical protein
MTPSGSLISYAVLTGKGVLFAIVHMPREANMGTRAEARVGLCPRGAGR